MMGHVSNVLDQGGVLGALEETDRILVQQVFKPIANEYRISVPTAGSTEEGTPVLFVKQKKLKVKEDIRFRLSPDAADYVFMIKAKTAFEFRGRYAVTDAAETVIGSIEKSFAKSLLRSHWIVRDASGEELFSSQETSIVIALIRRFIGLVPYLGTIGFLLQWVPFNFSLDRGETRIGSYHRVLGSFRDRYVLELTPDAKQIDRRVLVAFSIALDALQDR
jgi:uncharacterized protein YxjI